MNFIKKYKLPIPFLGSEEIIQRETIFSQAMYSDPTFRTNFRDWFSFYDTNKNNMHIYDVDGKWAEAVGDALQNTYSRLTEYVCELFDSKTNEKLYEMFPMPGVDKDTVLKFIEYAKYTYRESHRKIGSRFDYAINPDGDVFMYEINADTPSMLFESMNVQNLMSEALGDTDAQLNEIWQMSIDDPLVNSDSVTAVCAYNAEGEDFGTTESIAQLIENSGGAVYLTTINDLGFDPLEKDRSPFFMKCLPHLELDNVYVMLPWEETINSGMRIMDNWEVWKDKVQFFEPAWAWFLSDKSLIAHLTEGSTMVSRGIDSTNTREVNVYMSASLNKDSYKTSEGIVSKPAIGRKSSAITIHQENNGEITTVTSKDATYADGPMVYQPLRPTIALGDGTRVMGTMWMYNCMPACLGFREFDGDILENANERVIMHRLT